MEIKILSLEGIKLDVNKEAIFSCDKEELQEYKDKVVLENSKYKDIFGINFGSLSYLPWKRGIIKIEYNNKCVYRMFASGNSKGINKTSIGLTLESLNLLGINLNNLNPDNLKISKGSKTLFYWNHPKHNVRVAYKLGFVSVVCGIISLIPNLFSLLKFLINF